MLQLSAELSSLWASSLPDTDFGYCPHTSSAAEQSHISALDSGTGIQHDVFDRSLNILCPGDQPSNPVIMSDFFPFMSWRRRRSLGIFATVDNDVLRHDPSL